MEVTRCQAIQALSQGRDLIVTLPADSLWNISLLPSVFARVGDISHARLLVVHPFGGTEVSGRIALEEAAVGFAHAANTDLIISGQDGWRWPAVVRSAICELEELAGFLGECREEHNGLLEDLILVLVDAEGLLRAGMCILQEGLRLLPSAPSQVVLLAKSLTPAVQRLSADILYQPLIVQCSTHCEQELSSGTSRPPTTEISACSRPFLSQGSHHPDLSVPSMVRCGPGPDELGLPNEGSSHTLGGDETTTVPATHSVEDARSAESRLEHSFGPIRTGSRDPIKFVRQANAWRFSIQVEGTLINFQTTSHAAGSLEKARDICRMCYQYFMRGGVSKEQLLLYRNRLYRRFEGLPTIPDDWQESYVAGSSQEAFLEVAPPLPDVDAHDEHMGMLATYIANIVCRSTNEDFKHDVASILNLSQDRVGNTPTCNITSSGNIGDHAVVKSNIVSLLSTWKRNQLNERRPPMFRKFSGIRGDHDLTALPSLTVKGLSHVQSGGADRDSCVEPDSFFDFE